jgi:probable selenate reductase FAD-binding subunit
VTAVCAYRRPASLEEALAVLESSPGAVVLGGGTRLSADPAPGPVEVVDLQALRLDRIRTTGNATARIGAMATLQQVADSPALPAVLREAARRERPSTLRSQATLGGCVAAREGDSELLATLLAHDAVVSIADRGGTARSELAEFLAGGPLDRARIITDVTVRTCGAASAARTARTRADRPIVAAVARITATGERRLALAGVAATPVMAGERAGWADDLDPPGDFRGSGEYRRALAVVLASRAMGAIS